MPQWGRDQPQKEVVGPNLPLGKGGGWYGGGWVVVWVVSVVVGVLGGFGRMTFVFFGGKSLARLHQFLHLE